MSPGGIRGPGDAQAGVDRAHRAEIARAEQVGDEQRQRVVAIVEGLHQRPPRRPRGVGHSPGLVGVGRHRLFAQHRLAGLQGADGPFGVQAVGQGIVDGLDIRVVEQGLIVPVRSRHVMGPGEGRAPRRVARGHGQHLDPRREGPDIQQGRPGDAGAAQHADPQPSISGHGLSLPDDARAQAASGCVRCKHAFAAGRGPDRKCPPPPGRFDPSGRIQLL
jgi:hypothetical protein